MNEIQILNKYCLFFRENQLINKDRNLIGNLVQAAYRLFLLNNVKFKVLHASVSISKNGTPILLGDDGKDSKGKTFLSLIIAASSNKYVCDEYTLLLENEIYANKDIPIFIKEGVAEYLLTNDILDLSKNKKDGYLFADQYFEVVERVLPKFVIIPYLNCDQNKFYELKGQQKENAMAATYSGHLIKLYHPETDRISILKEKNVSERKVEDFIQDFQLPTNNLPVFQVELKDPKQIIGIIEEIEKTISL